MRFLAEPGRKEPAILVQTTKAAKGDTHASEQRVGRPQIVVATTAVRTADLTLLVPTTMRRIPRKARSIRRSKRHEKRGDPVRKDSRQTAPDCAPLFEALLLLVLFQFLDKHRLSEPRGWLGKFLLWHELLKCNYVTLAKDR